MQLIPVSNSLKVLISKKIVVKQDTGRSLCEHFDMIYNIFSDDTSLLGNPAAAIASPCAHSIISTELWNMEPTLVC